MDLNAPVSVSDATRTGMPYLPKEPVTPRGIELTRVDRLPVVGTTSPYKGDVEGNINMIYGGTESLKKRKIKTTELGALGDGPPKQEKEHRAAMPVATNKSISMHYTKAMGEAEVRCGAPLRPTVVKRVCAHRRIRFVARVVQERMERLARVPADNPQMDMTRSTVHSVPAPSPIATRFRPREGRQLAFSQSFNGLPTASPFSPTMTPGGMSGTFGASGYGTMQGYEASGGFGASIGGPTPSITMFPATYELPARVTASGRDGSLTSTHVLKVEKSDYMKTGHFADKVTRRRAFHMLPSSSYAAAVMEGVALAKKQFGELPEESKKHALYGEAEKPKAVTLKRGWSPARNERGMYESGLNGGAGADSRRPSSSGSRSNSRPPSATSSGRVSGSRPHTRPPARALSPLGHGTAASPSAGGASATSKSQRQKLAASQSAKSLTATPIASSSSVKRPAGANMFAGGYVAGPGGTKNVNDGAGGVITLEDKANALAVYQQKLAKTTGFGSRSYKGLSALTASGDGIDATMGARGTGGAGLLKAGYSYDVEDEDVAPGGGDMMSIPEKQPLPESYAEILNETEKAKKAKKKEKAKARRMRMFDLDSGLQASTMSSLNSSEMMDGDMPMSVGPDDVAKMKVGPPAMPTMNLVMQSWPHKTPGSLPPAQPALPPKLKSTLPLDHGAYVSWRVGEDVPVNPEAALAQSAGDRSVSPVSRMGDLQRSKRSPAVGGGSPAPPPSLNVPTLSSGNLPVGAVGGYGGGGVSESPSVLGGPPAAPSSPMRPTSKGFLGATSGSVNTAPPGISSGPAGGGAQATSSAGGVSASSPSKTVRAAGNSGTGAPATTTSTVSASSPSPAKTAVTVAASKPGTVTATATAARPIGSNDIAAGKSAPNITSVAGSVTPVAMIAPLPVISSDNDSESKAVDPIAAKQASAPQVEFNVEGGDNEGDGSGIPAKYQQYAANSRILTEDPYGPAAPDSPLKPKAAGHFNVNASGMPLHLSVRVDAKELQVPAAQREFVPLSKDLRPAAYGSDGMPTHLQKEIDEVKVS